MDADWDRDGHELHDGPIWMGVALILLLLPLLPFLLVFWAWEALRTRWQR